MSGTLRVYNSLTREKEDFIPIHAESVGMYVCGPTVYGPLHAGHARTMVAFDMIKCYIEHFRDEIERVTYISNITDVGHLVGDAEEGEDKIQKKASNERRHPMEIVDEYIMDMWHGYDCLKCDRPNIAPRATGHISEIIDAVQLLLEKGFAYELNGSVYFDVSKFPTYLNLSGNSYEELATDVRIQSKDSKRHPADFALWKHAEPNHIMQWTSPWGKGFPGWHIECSVMSQKYLGDRFDIHGGARELKFPHHENEIAQSECMVGHRTVNYWLHTGLLLIDGVKMAKSLGNFITVKELLDRHSPEVIRYFILANHYSKEVDMKEEVLVAAANSLKTIDNFIFQLLQNPRGSYSAGFSGIVAELEKEFRASMDDDFNTPAALANIFSFISRINRFIIAGDYDEKNAEEALSLMGLINRVFKFMGMEQKGSGGSSEAIIGNLIAMRKAARIGKDFKLSDEIREMLLASGIEIFDRKDGETTWRYI